MNNTPGTTVQAAGLTGLPFVIVLVMAIALAAVAIWTFKKKRRAMATLLGGGSLLFAYLLWDAWPILLVSIIMIVVGAVATLSIFDRLRLFITAGMHAVRKPVTGDDPSPAAAPPAATE